MRPVRRLRSLLAQVVLLAPMLAGCSGGPVFAPAPLQHHILTTWAHETGYYATAFPSAATCLVVEQALCPCAPARAAPAARAPLVLPEPERLDLAVADREALEGLPGVGPRTAERIIALRERGRLREVEDLLDVRGIGPARLRRLLPLVRVGGPGPAPP